MPGYALSSHEPHVSHQWEMAELKCYGIPELQIIRVRIRSACAFHIHSAALALAPAAQGVHVNAGAGACALAGAQVPGSRRYNK